MTTQSVETLIVMSARDEASRVMEQVGGSMDDVRQNAEKAGTTSTQAFDGMTGRLRRVGEAAKGVSDRLGTITGVLSGLGLGAVVGVMSFDFLIRKVSEARQEQGDFEKASLRAKLQLQLMGLSADQANERIAILERTMSRTSATALMNMGDAINFVGGANLDLVKTTTETADVIADKYGKDAQDVFNALQLAAADDFSAINEVFGLTGESAIETQERFREFLHETLNETDTFAKKFAKDMESLPGMGASVVAGLTPIAEFISNALPNSWDEFVDSIFGEGSLARMKASAAALVGAIGGPLSTFFTETVPGFVTSGFEGVGEWLKALFAPVGDIAGAIMTFFTETVPSWWDEGSVLRTTFEAAIGWIGDFFNAVADMPGKVKTFFTETIPGLWGEDSPLRKGWQAVIDWISGLWDTVKTTATEIFQSIVDTVWGEDSILRRGWQGFLDWWDEVTQPIRDFLSGVGEFLEDPGGKAGELLGFAQGGVVPGPIGAPMLAMVHGGEEIIPVGGTRRGGGHDVHVINVIVDGRVIKSIAREGVRESFVRAGLGPGAFASAI